MLVGREIESGQLELMLQSAARVTVAGPGGIGKSALAAGFARAAEAAGRHVVRWDAADAGAADELPDVLARLGPKAAGERPLLLLESCEHAPASCADLLARLASGGPGPQAVATCRHPLPGAVNLHLGPLVAPDALALFAGRAARHGTDVTATARSRALADEVCDLLERHPLALVLAAAQLPATPLPALAALLVEDQGCLALTADLADGPDGAGAPHRHRSLRCCLTWSHRLCTADEQLLWARLSVFPHAVTAASAWRVCADERLSGRALRTALEGLHHQSLVERRPDPRPGTWYGMPRQVRAYGAEQLRNLGEEPEFRRRCLEWSLDTPDLPPQ